VTVKERDLIFQLVGDATLHEKAQCVIEEDAKSGEHDGQHCGIKEGKSAADAQC
jgi:hypothetical protein